MEGYLEKPKSSLLKGYKKRWCVISDGVFQYYKKKTDTKIQGSFPLASCVGFAKTNKPNQFEVHVGEKKYLFLAANENDSLAWEKAFSSVKQIQQLRSPSRFRLTSFQSDSQRQSGPDAPEGRKKLESPVSPPRPIVDKKLTVQELFLIDPKTISFQNSVILGKGGFGTVEKAEWNGIEVAVKKMNRNCSLEDVVDELHTLCEIRHPRCMQLWGYCEQEGNIWLITEFVKGGSLRDLIRNKAKLLPNDVIIDIALGICQGMIYLHDERKMIHRDLKSANILIDSTQGEIGVKIADFGISKKVNQLADTQTEKVGTSYHMAPEVCLKNLYTTKSDVFSFAMILWECYNRTIPWPELNFSNQILSKIENGERPPLEDTNCPNEMKNLIKACWQHNPDKRPSFHEILNSVKALKTRSNRANSTESNGHEYLSTSSHPTATFNSTAYTKIWEEPANIDEAGIQVWVERLFGQKLSLPWTSLASILSHEWKIESMFMLVPLKNILEEDGLVQRDRFFKFLHWFFPITPDIDDSSDHYHSERKTLADSSTSNQFSFNISHVLSVAKAKWFHGFLSTEKSKKLLISKDSGTFLVRFSSSELGVYSLSVNHRGQVRHYKIVRVNNKCYTFFNTAKVFVDIISFVQFYSRQPVDFEESIGDVNLETPCPKADE